MRRPTRAVLLTAALGAAAATLLGVGSPPALAHLAIRLDIRSPQEGARVGSDVDAVVFAQPTLAGVDHTSFAADLDGHAIDPRSGRPAPTAVALDIKVNTEVHIPLRGLGPGRHRLAVGYRPDTDEPVSHVSVAFVAAPAGHHGRRNLLAAMAAVVVAAALVAWLIARRRRNLRGVTE